MTLKSWLTRIVHEQFGNIPTALAQAMGISLTSFNRGRDTGTFSIENLLRLAEVTNSSPGLVLRLAGKPVIADQLERLYGITELTPEEQRHLAMWRKASTTSKGAIDTLLHHLTDDEQNPPDTLTPSRKKSSRVLRSVSGGVGYVKKS